MINISIDEQNIKINFDIQPNKDNISSEFVFRIHFEYSKFEFENIERIVPFLSKEENERIKSIFPELFIFKLDEGEIELKNKDNQIQLPNIFLNQVRYRTNESSLTICSKLTLKDILKIYDLLGNDEIIFRIRIVAYGLAFTNYRMQQEIQLENSYPILLNIYWQNDSIFKISKDEFKKKLFPLINNKEFIEIDIKDYNRIKKNCPEEFKDIVEVLLSRQELLLRAIKKLYQATDEEDYITVFDEIKRTFDNWKTGERKQLKQKMIAHCNGIQLITGEGAVGEITKQVDMMLNLFDGIENIANGFAHTSLKGSKEHRKPIMPHPRKYDAKNLLLLSIITIDYFLQRVLLK